MREVHGPHSRQRKKRIKGAIILFLLIFPFAQLVPLILFVAHSAQWLWTGSLLRRLGLELIHTRQNATEDDPVSFKMQHDGGVRGGLAANDLADFGSTDDKRRVFSSGCGLPPAVPGVPRQQRHVLLRQHRLVDSILFELVPRVWIDFKEEREERKEEEGEIVSRCFLVDAFSLFATVLWLFFLRTTAAGARVCVNVVDL